MSTTNQTTREDAKCLDTSLSERLLNAFKMADLAEQLKNLQELTTNQGDY